MATLPQVLANTPVPLPADWARLHEMLSIARKSMDRNDIPNPPTPLILSGAAFSTAAAIRERWNELLTWAADYGFVDVLLANLPAPPSIDVPSSIAGIGEDGKGWWPNYGEQVHSQAPKPGKDVVLSAVAVLRAEWPEVAGPELARITEPLRLLGAKKRRLLVAADPSATPPWGTWISAHRNPQAFSLFRQSVNARIAPLAVDEITFATNRWGNRVA
jgi:hypothetical protein